MTLSALEVHLLIVSFLKWNVWYTAANISTDKRVVWSVCNIRAYCIIIMHCMQSIYVGYSMHVLSMHDLSVCLSLCWLQL